MLQKLVYLLGQKRRDDLAYYPHYYGPYSHDVRTAIDNLVVSGYLNETSKALEPWEASQFDVKQYSYAITETGREAASLLPAGLSEDANGLVATAKVKAWSQEALAIAAKILYLEDVEPGIDRSELPYRAKSFGWKVPEAAVSAGLQLLDNLGLSRDGGGTSAPGPRRSTQIEGTVSAGDDVGTSLSADPHVTRAEGVGGAWLGLLSRPLTRQG